MDLSERDRRRLADEENAAGYEYIAEQDLGMDSHGCNVVLVVIRHGSKDSRLEGFTYRYSSEERFFEDESPTLIALQSREVTTVEYYQAEGRAWSDYV